MNKSGQNPRWAIFAVFAFVLATPGCASKKYVSKQMAQVHQQHAQFEKQTNDRIAWLNNKQQSDTAAVNERIAGAEQKASEVAAAIQETQGSASRAMEAADEAKTSSSEAISKVENNANNAMNYQLVEKSDVLFGFNKANLTPAAKTTLDEIAAKCQSTPGAVVELAGFTDRVGSANYNLSLSRRRAWTVQRYLVEHNVPLRAIHVVGLGEQNGPEEFARESDTSAATTGKNGRNSLDRRVNIRLYGPGEQGAASRSEETEPEQ